MGRNNEVNVESFLYAKSFCHLFRLEPMAPAFSWQTLIAAKCTQKQKEQGMEILDKNDHVAFSRFFFSFFLTCGLLFCCLLLVSSRLELVLCRMDRMKRSPSQEKSMIQHLVCNPGCHINAHDCPHPAHGLQEGRREWWTQTVLGIFCPEMNKTESHKGKLLLRNGSMKRVVESSQHAPPPQLEAGLGNV